MLELDINKSKSLNFEIQLSGIDSKDLDGSLRIVVDGVEYGFKVEVTSSSIIASIPVLKSILPREVKEGEQLNAKLEVHGSGYYLNPWNGSFVVKNPVLMEAKIKEDSDKVPKITAKIKPEVAQKVASKLSEAKKVVSKPIVEKVVEKQNSNIKDIVITEKHVVDYMKSKGTTSKQVQEVILEQCKGNAKTDDPKDILRSVIRFYKNKDQK